MDRGQTLVDVRLMLVRWPSLDSIGNCNKFNDNTYVISSSNFVFNGSVGARISASDGVLLSSTLSKVIIISFTS